MKIIECNKPIAENTSRLIEERGLKQVYVAKKAGFGKQQFNDMLNGRRIIKPCDALAIAKALNVTMNDLYEATEGRDR